jgi:hypothetical protein
MDGCDYTGPTRSVEAHVSGSSDEAHSGQLGRNWRSTIEASHEEQQPAIEPGERAEVATEEATEAPGEESSNGDLALSPGLTLVVATVAFALVVVVASADAGSGEVEEIEEETEDGSDSEPAEEVMWDA